MFLKRIVIRVRHEQDGMALIAAIGVMAVGLLLSSLILASVVGGYGFTSSTKAGVQSQASAEAGVAVAVASLKSGQCAVNSGNYVSATNAVPIYNVSVWSQNSAGTWAQGCPVAGTLAVKIVSNGTASATGVAGASGGDSSTVEALFTTDPPDAPITAAGPAVYAYSSQGFSGSGTLVSADGEDANVMVKEGDVNCSGGAGMDADLVVNNGNLALSGSCNVTGNVWVSGTLTMTGGVTVSGNVTAGVLNIPNGTVGGSAWSVGSATISSATINGNVTAGGAVSLKSSHVGGSVWSGGKVTSANSSTIGLSVIAAGDIELQGSETINANAWSGGNISLKWGGLINGNATSKTMSMNGGDIKGMSWGSTSVTHTTSKQISGSLTTKQLIMGSGPTPRYLGTMTINSGGVGSGPTPPTATPPTPAPNIPAWVDFVYNTADWDGFSVATISGTCNYTAFKDAVASFGTQPGIIDARGCSGALAISGNKKNETLTIKNDVAIFGNSWSLSGGGYIASDNPHKLWFITPDTTPNHQPTCTSPAGNFTINGGFEFTPNIDIMVYSPCKVTIASGIRWRGQVFAGQVDISGGAVMTFVPVGLPNVDLTTGLYTIQNPSDVTWTLVTTRNVGQ